MNSTDCPIDNLLCRSLTLFREFRLYDDYIVGDNAFKALREAEKIVTETKDGVYVAKLGCVVECLAQRFYIDEDTDGALEEVDTFLIKYWKRLKSPPAEAFAVSLWIGEYFLLRLKNHRSRSHNRSKKMVSKILVFMIDILRKSEKQKVDCLSSNSVFEEIVDWIKGVCDMGICEKQIVVLLEKLNSIQNEGGLRDEGEKNVLRQKIWSFYY